MAFGNILREARERKGLTAAQVAETTRMLPQIVEDLEVENFKRIAAPLYGRGFVKLYAGCVGLDPAPLLDDFNLLYNGAGSPAAAAAAAKPREEDRTPKPLVPRADPRPKPPAPAPMASADPLPQPAPVPENPDPVPSSEVPSPQSPPEDPEPPEDFVTIIDEPPVDDHDLFNYGPPSKPKPKPADRGNSAPLPQQTLPLPQPAQKPAQKSSKSALRRVARSGASADPEPAAPAPRPNQRVQNAAQRVRETAQRILHDIAELRKNLKQPPLWFWVVSGGAVVVFLVLAITLATRGSSKPPVETAPVSRYVFEPPEFYAD